MSTLLQDLRYGARMLMKKPGFTLIAVVTLALGIGANTAIFSVVNSVLLRPLPYHQPEQLVMLWENDTQEGNDRNSVAPANFNDWRQQNEVCTELAHFGQPFGVGVTGSGDPERIMGLGVSHNIFSVVGVQPMLGRNFLAVEGNGNPEQEVIISYGLWQRRFGGETNVLGKTMNLDGAAFAIVGVMPPQFQLPEEAELWIQNLNGRLQIRNRFFMRVAGRLKPGVTIQQAQANFTTIARRLEQQYPDTNKGRGINVVSFREQLVGDVKPALLVMFVAVGFVLLIACANVANLLLVRAAARQQELAIRAALGAGRGRLMRQLLTESLLLALAGGVLGVLLALWGIDLLANLSSAKAIQAEKIRLDTGVFAFTFFVTLLTGLFCGLAPAWQVSKPNLHDTLKESGRSAADSVQRRRLRGLLVVAEIALSLVLLIGAGLMINSFSRLMSVEPGFDPANVLTMQFSLSSLKYDKPEKVVASFQQMIERIAALPGVRAVGAISRMPMAGDRSTSGMRIESREARPGEGIEVHYRVATPGYFRALNIPLRAGRPLSEQDTKDAPGVVMINENAARRYWPNEDPVGKRIRLGPNPNAPFLTIIGVAGEARNFGLDNDARPEVYIPYQQNPDQRMRLAIRTETAPLSIVSGVRAAVRAVDPDLPLAQVMTMDEMLSKSIAQRRLNMLLLGVFAAVALLLAAVGIYGVMSSAVAQRTHEIGVRMALGARASDVLKLVIKQAMMLTAIGVTTGLIASLMLTRLMKNLLFQVSPTDPLTFALIALLLTAVALLACWLPARRAAKVDPMVALRWQ